MFDEIAKTVAGSLLCETYH